jgi:hypothetical protein
MLRFDHMVICSASDTGIMEKLSNEVKSSLPLFKPGAVKEGKGFKTFALSFGRQYIEIVEISNADAEGLNKHWLRRFKEGRRGVVALFLASDDLDSLSSDLKERYMDVQRSERSVLGSILEVLNLQAQKQNVYLPEIPGTGLEVDFIQYDEKTNQNAPNEPVLPCISKIMVFIPEWTEGLEFLKKVFPELRDEKMEKRISLSDNGQLFFYRTSVKEPAEVQIEVLVPDASQAGKKIKLENLEIKTIFRTDK